MRVKRGYRTGSKESYNTFCERNPSIKISFDVFRKVLYHFNQLFVDHLFYTGEPIKQPYGIGNMIVCKSKPKKYVTVGEKTYEMYPIDWKLSREAGKYVRTLNMHTDGYKFNVGWFPSSSRLKCSFIWSFKVARDHARKLASLLKDPTRKYKDLYRVFQRRK